MLFCQRYYIWRQKSIADITQKISPKTIKRSSRRWLSQVASKECDKGQFQVIAVSYLPAWIIEFEIPAKNSFQAFRDALENDSPVALSIAYTSASHMIGYISLSTPIRACFSPSSVMISVKISTPGPSIVSDVSIICTKYDACIRKRRLFRMSGEEGSMFALKPNSVFPLGQSVKNLQQHWLSILSVKSSV